MRSGCPSFPFPVASYSKDLGIQYPDSSSSGGRASPAWPPDVGLIPPNQFSLCQKFQLICKSLDSVTVDMYFNHTLEVCVLREYVPINEVLVGCMEYRLVSSNHYTALDHRSRVQAFTVLSRPFAILMMSRPCRFRTVIRKFLILSLE